MSEKKELNKEELNKVNGGQSWQEEVEGSRNCLPEGEVTCQNLFCQKTFNAKENAFGFMNISYENGTNVTFPIAKCPYCGSFWKY